MVNEEQIYFDSNVYRPITRDPARWQKFKECIDKEEPGLLDRSSAVFTWGQTLELCGLGKIMAEIEKTQIWKAAIEGKGLLDLLRYDNGLSCYFEMACKAIESLPALQKKDLLESLDKAIQHTCQEARSVVDDTLGRYRAAVAADNYMNDLSRELAWAFLTSYPFAQSEKQWKTRKIYYDCLIALWHGLFSEGHDLVFFRLAERQFEASLKYSAELEMEKIKTVHPYLDTRKDLVEEIFKKPPLKATSDLCDGELIHFAYLGCTLKGSQKPVVCITKDDPVSIQQRMDIFGRSLTDLTQLVDGWIIERCAGRILSLEVVDDGAIKKINRHLP